jgi:hypothetical protein
MGSKGDTDIKESRRKEFHYLINLEVKKKGERWYLQWYTTKKRRKIRRKSFIILFI